MKKSIKLGLIASGAIAASLANAGNKITIATGAEPTSIDPQFHNVTSNITVSSLMFEELTYYGKGGVVSPRLATSWKQLPGDKVEFNLRKGVKFHDGSDFTANDVVYTICRMRTVKNSPSSFAFKAAMWKDIEVVNDHKIIVTKPNAAPKMISYAAQFHILSDSAIGSSKINFNGGQCDGFKYVETAEFDSGKAVVGTGPYKLKSYTKGEKIIVEKNPKYWGNGTKGGNIGANFDEMDIRAIKNKGSRVAALLSGDVDAIEAPSVQDLPRLKKDKNLQVIVNDPVRSIYVMFNVEDSHDKIKGTNGKNPFQDVRVREALSLAIDRNLIVKRVMGELGQTATTVAPETFYGIEKGKTASSYEYNPKKAKQLLADAGYPNGFEITFGAPNDRYINDAKVAQAIAQMWTRIGVKTNLEAVTKSLFFGNRNKKAYPVWFAGWGVMDYDATSFVSALASSDKSKKRGASQKGSYSNPKIDALLDTIDNTADDAKREVALKKAVKLVNEDLPFFMTHYERFPLAMKKTVSYTPPTGGETTHYRYFAPVK